MGNHEYCEDCGENDFHLGRECNPEKVKKKKEEEEKSRLLKHERHRDIKCKLDSLGISYYYNGDHFIIN